jgi:two-component system, sensor histidine kinase and response regulator
MMLTSGGQRGGAARWEELGIGAYLIKPVRQAELREAVIRVLHGKQERLPVPLITRFSLRDKDDSFRSLHILLAEDNRVNQKIAIRLLEKRGHHVVLAGNGKEALGALAQRAFDLVLMDGHMPGMDGFEATTAIREKEKSTGLHQPIIAMTAMAMTGDRERCLAAGMDGYLSKPIELQQLDEVLAVYAGRSCSDVPNSPKARGNNKEHNVTARYFLSPLPSHSHWKVRGRNERRPEFTGIMDRSMQMKQNVSCCNNGPKVAEGS